LGGGHAIYLDAATGDARNLDCFVAVPSGKGAPMDHLQVRFGEELVDYAVGASSFGVPGLPAGLDALWRTYGRVPRARRVEPALRLARDGVAMPPAHAAGLRMLEPVMTMREGAAIYSPGGSLLKDGDMLSQPGLVHALTVVAEEGAATAYTGTVASALLELSDERGGSLTPGALAAYRADWPAPVEVRFAGRRIMTRGGLSGIPETLARFDP